MIEDPKHESTPTNGQSIEIIQISDTSSLAGSLLTDAIDVYRQAFAQRPYNENFTDAEAEAALRLILARNGDLLLGKLAGRVVSLTGGYERTGHTYFIEELAVAPQHQGCGYGRRTLDALLQLASHQGYEVFRVRSTASNTRAINLYTSEGFAREATTEAVAHRRIGGGIFVDERAYLSRPLRKSTATQVELHRLAVAYPSGNTTALVFDQMLTVDRKDLNDRIMRAWKQTHPNRPEIEQCCFITPALTRDAVARVEMFGGEFCGNATRSAVWLITGGINYSGLIEVSGVEEPLWFRIDDRNVSVEMPLPSDRDSITTVEEGTLVSLSGITQLVVTDARRRQAETPRELLNRLLSTNKYHLTDQPAVGVSFYEVDTRRAEFCVWVDDVDTIFDETACGSGTCAIGLAVSAETGTSLTLPVVQPSGETITTGSEYNSGLGKVVASAITGRVMIYYDGEFTAT